MKARPHETLVRLLGSALVGLGLLLLLLAGGYRLLASRAQANLDRLEVHLSSATSTDLLPAGWRQVQGQGLATGPPEALPAPLASPEDGVAPAPTQEIASTAPEPAVPSAPEDAGLPSGRLWGGSEAARPDTRPMEPRFQWVDWSTLPATLGVMPGATRIAIPAIGLDAPVVELTIVWDGDRRAWQRAKNSTGHHLGTANPGEIGNLVISGHISSPVRGEGSVFRHLSAVPALLEGEVVVEAFIYTEEKTYIYRILGSRVVRADAMGVLAPTAEPTVTLITCVPDLVYSHRLVVTGLLVKVAEGGSPSRGQVVDGPVVSPAA